MQDCGDGVNSGSSSPASAATPKATNPLALLDSPDRLNRLFRDHWQVICLVVISLCMHMYILSFANQMIYDEVLWVPEAKHIVLREPLDWPTYPALSKLFMASGVYTLGDNQWGWRIPSVLFGIASIVLIYLITRRLAGKRTALLAALLFTTENLVFTWSGLALLDVFAVAFMLLSFLLYLNHRYALSGLALALAVLCSPKALLAVFAILAHWFFVRRKRGLRNIGVFAVSSLLAFLALLPITDLIATGQWLSPFHRIIDMWTSQTSAKVSKLTAEELAVVHPTRPWEWLLERGGSNLHPTELHHNMLITPTIWMLIIPSMIYLLYRVTFVKEHRNAPRFVLLWFSATYLPWIPLYLITDRVMLHYYLLPTMGAICIAVGYGMHRAWQSVRDRRRIIRWPVRAFLVLYIIIHVGLFLLLSPLTTPLLR